MYTDEFISKGWYDKAERILTLSQPFVFDVFHQEIKS